jgi:hypothetical protein
VFWAGLWTSYSADGRARIICGGLFAPILKAFAGDLSWTSEITPLGMVTEAYVQLLYAWHQARAAGSLKDDMFPVLVIDEADVLMRWKDESKAELQTLLSFFVSISKAQRQSHVILATSDHSFRDWLSKGTKFCQIVHQHATTQTPLGALLHMQCMCIYCQSGRPLVGPGLSSVLLAAATIVIVLVGHILAPSKLFGCCQQACIAVALLCLAMQFVRCHVMLLNLQCASHTSAAANTRLMHLLCRDWPMLLRELCGGRFHRKGGQGLS